MDPQTLLNDTLRAQTYKVLVECYYPPGDDLMVGLKELTESSSAFITQIADKAEEVTDLEPLRVDHAKLFVGP